MKQHHQEALRRTEERIQLEMQFAGSVIFYSVARGTYVAQDVLAICPPNMLISPKAKAIMHAVRSVCSRGEPVDLVTTGLELKTQAKGGKMPLGLDELAQYVSPSSALISESSVMEAAHVLAGEWRKDKAVVEMGNAVIAMQTFASPPDLALASIKEAQAILDAEQGSDSVTFGQHLDEYAANLSKPESKRRPVKTPWDSANRILRGGVLPTELVILAARPGVGKSALALNWAWSVARSGKTVPFFSLEMGREQLIDRLMSNISGVDLGAFREGLSRTQMHAVKDVIGSIKNYPLNIIDDPRITVNEVRRRVRIAQRKSKDVGLVVIDYLQLCTPDDMRTPREQQVATMSRGFKLLAKELSVPVLLLAQLSRKGEDANRPPILSDLRESGSIEQDADVVMFLHQARKKTWHPDEPVQLIVAKGRSSGVGRESLIFKRRVQRFEESTDEIFRSAVKEDDPVYTHWSENEQNELM